MRRYCHPTKCLIDHDGKRALDFGMVMAALVLLFLTVKDAVGW